MKFRKNKIDVLNLKKKCHIFIKGVENLCKKYIKYLEIKQIYGGFLSNSKNGQNSAIYHNSGRNSKRFVL